MRDSLYLLLTTIPQVAHVDKVSDSPSLMHHIRQYPPDLILMDTNHGRDAYLGMLRMVKAEAPFIPCLVIVDNARQQSMARDAGADGMLLRGFSSMELAGQIRRMV
jgi:DNA-binding NarL/FixJ family response regulator